MLLSLSIHTCKWGGMDYSKRLSCGATVRDKFGLAQLFAYFKTDVTLVCVLDLLYGIFTNTLCPAIFAVNTWYSYDFDLFFCHFSPSLSEREIERGRCGCFVREP